MKPTLPGVARQVTGSRIPIKTGRYGFSVAAV